MKIIINGSVVDPNILTDELLSRPEVNTLEIVPDGDPLPDHVEETLRSWHIKSARNLHQALEVAYAQSANSNKAYDEATKALMKRQHEVNDVAQSLALATLVKALDVQTQVFFAFITGSAVTGFWLSFFLR